MQIYLSSHDNAAELVALVQETLAKQQLQADVTQPEVLPIQHTRFV